MSVLTWPLLAKINARGKPNVWVIEFDPAQEQLITQSGQYGGKYRSTVIRVALNSSGRDIHAQGQLEGHNLWRKKIHDGFLPFAQVVEDGDTPAFSEELTELVNQTLNDQSQAIHATPAFQPMLANTFAREKQYSYPMFAQAKLDGIRMTTSVRGGRLLCLSRMSGQFQHLEHLKTPLRALLEALPEDSILDGELYSPELPMNEIAARVRQGKKPHPLEHQVQYYIYDIYTPERPDMAAGERWCFLSGVCSALDIPVPQQYHAELPTTPLVCLGGFAVDDLTEIEAALELVLQDGAEGLMLRHVEGKLSAYRFGRSDHLLKYKVFEDKEVVIIGATVEDNTVGDMVVWQVRDEHTNEFFVRPRGTHEERKALWLEWPRYVGKLLTIRYQGALTAEQVPRFPVGITIRDYEPVAE